MMFATRPGGVFTEAKTGFWNDDVKGADEGTTEVAMICVGVWRGDCKLGVFSNSDEGVKLPRGNDDTRSSILGGWGGADEGPPSETKEAVGEVAAATGEAAEVD